MLRSMYSGISGLKNHQTKLDVIGNNISNVNTYGFKKSRVVFKDLISQNISGASAATPTRGGINSKQVGLGSQIAAIDTIHGSGSLQTTSRTLDLAISGDGFFQVADSAAGLSGYTNTQYTRAGNFYMDADGYLVNSDGKYLVGFDANTYLLNGDQRVDENGTAITPSTPPTQADIDALNEALRVEDGKLVFGEEPGTIAEVDYDGETYPIEVNLATGVLTFTDKNGETYTLTGDSAALKEGGDPATDTITISLGNNYHTAFNSAISAEGKLTFESALTTLKPIRIPTTAQSMSIGQDGTVNFVDKDGVLLSAGQIQLAKFPNTGGLEKVGGNYYQETTNSGVPVLGFATESGIGSIQSGFLEMSNVDLSEEFTEMIVAQRGFQANSRIITTSDEILQELVNLKR
ncbi:flagellar hook-basal body complex protein [Ureibacillus acetophenoni]|uniref:Flagellar hook protein FlgE n=1 Tax=Ureibacillus acetophenoni TaxID=614649 RepID=A0A285U1F1_9BACL|nr:flagellar hook-basal body complex protein [Ureibacillus acetophenoni]SOC35537.1 flagellar hook protein FlgE [Ureibacillus acetophenoni]